MNIRVLKMLIQPFVENAVIHGLVPKETDRKLEIFAMIEDDNLLITIKDNGVGMAEEHVNKINENMNNMSIKKKSELGLENSNKCLKLVFGDEYGVSIKSKLGNGTTVLIKSKYLI